MDLNSRLTEYRSLIDTELERQLALESEHPPRIRDAMAYSVLNGGKRIRPILALESGRIFQAGLEFLLPVCAPLEFVQAFTLIHDDLPCMDDAILRRGLPALHVAYDEALALLAGDALLNLAFGAIAREGIKNFPPDRVLCVIIELCDALGVQGVTGGQVMDINSDVTHYNLNDLKLLHSMKTGSFFRFSSRMGAILAGASNSDIERLSKYGDEFGLTFQITDDILDATGTLEELGKDVGQDTNLNRTTYVSEYGIAGAREEARKACDRAKDSLKGLPNTDFLVSLVEFLLERRK